MRAREFVMMDAYSFDTSDNLAIKSYGLMFEAYKRFFKRVGVTAIPVEADTGVMGGSFSHEFMVPAEIGDDVNIGCGTITCNYAADKRKYKTKIGNRVFVGSDTQFVAPIEVGDDAVIGSGSTITKDVPAKALAVARGKQIIKENYQPKVNEVLMDPSEIMGSTIANVKNTIKKD